MRLEIAARLVVCGASLAILGGCVDDTVETARSSVVESTGPQFSSEDAAQISEALRDELTTRYGNYVYSSVRGGAASADFLDYGRLSAYLSRVTKRLERASGRRLEVRVLDVEEVISLAFPDGTVVLSRGSVMEARNGHELAGLIGHETAHVQRGDLARVWDEASGKSPGAKALGVLLREGFSQPAERAADRRALSLMKEAGYVPAAYKAYWARLRSVTDTTRLKLLRRTHPDLAGRIESLEEWLAENGASRGLPPADNELLRIWEGLR